MNQDLLTPCGTNYMTEEDLKRTYTPMSLQKSIDISLAENDDQGRCSRKVGAIEFSFDGEVFARLEPTHDIEEVVNTSDHRIEMYGYFTKVEGRHAWAGSMIWNSYATPVNYALGFINMLRLSKRWALTEGYIEIAKKWENRGVMTFQDIVVEAQEVIEPKILNSRAEMQRHNPKITFEIPPIPNLPGEDISDPDQTKLEL